MFRKLDAEIVITPPNDLEFVNFVSKFLNFPVIYSHFPKKEGH